MTDLPREVRGPADAAALGAALWPAQRLRSYVYAVLDGARWPGLVEALAESNLEHACLFAGPLGDAVRRAAPYLVRLTPEHPFLTPLAEAFGDSRGVYLTSPAELTVVRRHLRTILRVVDENGRFLLFRWYDPRVLRVYLPTLTAAEATKVAGPLYSLGCESDDGASLERWDWDGRRLLPSTQVVRPIVVLPPLPPPRPPVEF